jgi:hypothetical protein
MLSATPASLIRARQILATRKRKQQQSRLALVTLLALLIAAATAYGATVLGTDGQTNVRL